MCTNDPLLRMILVLMALFVMVFRIKMVPLPLVRVSLLVLQATDLTASPTLSFATCAAACITAVGKSVLHLRSLLNVGCPHKSSS